MTSWERDRQPPAAGFREGQVLAAADLEAAARARREERWRHNRELHGAGIVRGLELGWQKTGLVLCPGVAFDPLGRELVVARPQEFGAEGEDEVSLHALLKDRGPEARLDLWLAYHESEQDAPGGGPRVIEGARVHYTITAPGEDARRLSARFAAVFLGRVGRVRLDAVASFAGTLPFNLAPDSDGFVLTNERADRIYVPAVGDRIEAPSKQVRVLLGPEAADDVRRFAVAVADPHGVGLVDRVVIESDGRARFRGDVVVAGPGDPTPPQVRVGDNRAGFGRRDGLAFAGTAPAPAVARPWHVYRAAATDKQTKATTDQLRFEVFNPGTEGIPFLHRLAVGVYRPVAPEAGQPVVEQFCPILIVGADGNVIIPNGPGDTVTWLVVRGGEFVHQAGGGGLGAAAGVGGGPAGGPAGVLPLGFEMEVVADKYSSADDNQAVRHITFPLTIRVAPAPPAGPDAPLTEADAVRDVALTVVWRVLAAGTQPRQQTLPFPYFVPHNAPLTVPVNLAIPADTLPADKGVKFLLSAAGRTADGRTVTGAYEFDKHPPA